MMKTRARLSGPDKKYARRKPSVVSYNMSQIRSSGSAIEIALYRALTRQGLRPKKQPKILGRPDFAFPRLRIAIFCDSHFWHGYKWSQRKLDLKHNSAFWINKIERNIARDQEVSKALQKEGWRVFRFWEHQIEHAADRCVMRIKNYITKRRATESWQ